MARQRKSDVVDGFNVYRAAQRAEKLRPESTRGTETSPPESGTPNKRPADPAIGKRIGRTVLPSKHDITCYECGYAFQLTGIIKNTYCPKCRANLTVEDVTVAGNWNEEIKTAGSVHILPGGVVEGGIIMANHIICEGAVTGGEVQAFRWLELRGKATYDPERMQGQGLRIGAGVTLILPELRYHDVEVFGVLKSRIVSSGVVRVMSGGLLEGELLGQHLEVQEGGGLRAELRVVNPERLAEDDEPLPLDKTA